MRGLSWAGLDLERPRIVGVLNVTPDSFYDGGRYIDTGRALEHATKLVVDGADLIEIGGESTRPGAQAVPLEEERRRVIPVVECIARALSVPIAVDTSQPEIMQAAHEAGARVINDVRGFGHPDALATVARLKVSICLMHMRGEPGTMQVQPVYDDVLGEVARYLIDHAEAAQAAGISRPDIAIDPGFGFGKTQLHNLALLRGLDHFSRLGYPLMVGLSRKSLIGALTGRPPGERLAGSLAAACLALESGARLIRTHDAAETRDVIRIWEAARGASPVAA
ncbi:dihydropteroate synthase [mine drainage metagenome]|uniref:dihydropteroate synthase n=3 Tax=mine drainage metagenome TaxID=410659 RepID=T1B9N7_9ZZZZ